MTCERFIKYWTDANYIYFDICSEFGTLHYKINTTTEVGFKLNSSYDINEDSMRYEIDRNAATFNVKIDENMEKLEQLESILKQILTLN